jgi:uncharacterized protein (TIGR03382 family)
MKLRFAAVWWLVAGGAVACSTTPRADGTPLVAGDEASMTGAARWAELRTLFPQLLRDERAVAPGLASALEVHLPAFADETTSVGVPSSRMHIGKVLGDAKHVSRMDDGAWSLFRGGFGVADVLQRVHAAGVEDYVLFAHRPPVEELRYDLDISGVAGLRLVANQLEFLDADGAPRVRITPPVVEDATGLHPVHLGVEGCAVDADPAPPWRRAVVSPGRTSCQLLLAWAGISYPALVDPNWISGGALAVARGEHTATVVGAAGLVLLAGGRGPSLVGAPIDSAELYDPATGTFAATGSMNVARAEHTATLLTTGASAGKVLIVGGSGSGAYPDLETATTELFDPGTGTFTVSAPLGAPRTRHAAAVLKSGKVLVVGGELTTGIGAAALETTELYDPKAGTFSAGPPMSVSRTRLTATTITIGSRAGDVLVAGGTTSTSGPDGLSGFDGDSSTWRTTAEIFASGSQSFSASQPMAIAMGWHRSAALPDGKIVLAGTPGPPPFDRGQSFDPTTSTFTTSAITAPTGAAIEPLTVGSDDSGKVLVVGGRFTNAAAVYDRVTDQSTPRGNLTTARSFATAITLTTGPNAGKVLVAGGIYKSAGNTFFALPSAELYVGLGARCNVVGDCAGVGVACTDGVCCDSNCNEQCKACDVAGSVGRCSSVKGAPHGVRTGCAPSSDPICGASACDGVTTASCTFVPAATTCGQSCNDAQLISRACDGLGRCVAGSVTACTKNLGCAGPSACKERCDVDADCTNSLSCSPSGACVPASSCAPSDDHTAVSARGSVQDCAPYRCGSAGACNTKCVSVDDCAVPNACDPAGRCVPPATPTGDAGGCASTHGQKGWPGAALVLLVLMATLARRRT